MSALQVILIHPDPMVRNKTLARLRGHCISTRGFASVQEARLGTLHGSTEEVIAGSVTWVVGSATGEVQDLLSALEALMGEDSSWDSNEGGLESEHFR